MNDRKNQKKMEPKGFRPAIGREVHTASGKTSASENAPLSASNSERMLFIGKAMAVLERAEKMKKNTLGMFPDGAFDKIISTISSNIDLLKNAPPESVQDHWKNILVAIDLFDKIDEDLTTTVTAKEGESDTLHEELKHIKEEQAKQLHRIKLLMPLATKYNILETTIHDIQTGSASIVSNKADILTVYNELSWVADLDNLEEIAAKKSEDEIKVASTKLEELTKQAQEAAALLKQNELEKKLQVERVDKMKKSSKRFEELTAEADTLTVADDVKTSLREKEEIVKSAKDAFETTLTADAYDAFVTALNDYQKIIESTKKSVKSFTPPPFLSGSTQPVPQERAKTAPATSAPEKPQSYLSLSLNAFDPRLLKNTEIEGLIGNWDKGYEVKIGLGKVPILNKKLVGTILRYKALSEILESKGVNFTRAETLKMAVLDAIHSDDFKQAGEHARELGDVLNAIVRKRFTPSVTTQDALDAYARMSGDPKYTAADFSKATSIRDSILELIDRGDSDLATTKSKALKKTLDEFGTKKITVEKKPAPTPEIKPTQNQAPITPVAPSKQQPAPESILFTGTVRKNGESLEIKIGNEFIEIPRRVDGVLRAYKRVFRNSDKQGVEFAQATVYKNAILKSVNSGDFEAATKHAHELSKFLFALENPSLVTQNPQTTTQPTIQQEQKIVQQDKIKNNAVGEIISILTKNRFSDSELKKREGSGQNEEEALLSELAQWEKNWIQDGKIDAFREKFGNITISDEQVQNTKKLLNLYLEILRSGEGLSSDLTRTAAGNIILYVKILAGRQDDARSDIKYLVNEYRGQQDEALFEKVRAQLNEGKTSEAPVKAAEQEALYKQKSIEQTVAAVTLLRGSALRPTVSGPVVSLEMSKRNFEIQKSAFLNANGVLEKMLPYLQSDLEKAAFARMKADIEKQQTEIEANPTKEAITIFSAKIERYIAELSKKVKFVTKVYGTSVFEQDLFEALPAGTMVMRSKRLRGNEDKEEAVESWLARQDLNNWLKKMQPAVKTKSSQEIASVHNEMFKREPVLYKHVYGTENTLRGQKTEEVVSKTLQGKVVQSPKEHLQELTKERNFLEVLWKKLHDDLAKGVAFGNPEGEKKLLRARIELLDEQIQKYTKLVLDEVTNPSHSTPGLSAKQMYNPQADLSLNDKTRGEYVQNEKGKVVPLDRTTLTQEEVQKLGKESGQLRSSIHPNHTEGLVSSLNKKEAEAVLQDPLQSEKPYKTNGPENAQAIYNKDEQLMKEELKTLEVSPDNQKERHSAVNKLANWLFGYPSTKKYKWGALAAGILTLGLSSGVAMGATPKVENRARTLADFIKEQPSWKVTAQENVPSNFIEGLAQQQKIKFEDFMKEYAPSFKMSPNNPSAKEKLELLNCTSVYDIVGAKTIDKEKEEFSLKPAGLAEDQQREASKIIDHLSYVIKSAKASTGTLYPKNSRVFDEKMSILDLYDMAIEEIAKADAAHAKLKTI